jgi:hypothetical protein
MPATFPAELRFIWIVVGGKAMSRTWRTAVAFLILSGGAAIASAQYGSGYNTPYRDQSDPADYAAHWGYQDGFYAGSHDRATGHSFRPTHGDKYEDAPEYGHPSISRNDYKNIYREAYVRGYERGYGR